MIRLLTLALCLSSAQASNYPPDYCDQTVRVVNQGPVLFASVGSGCMSGLAIGYRKSGVLAKLEPQPESLDAIVVGDCPLLDGSWARKTSIVKLGKEWRGTGYMSTSLYYYQFLPQNCITYGASRARVGVAFSDGKDRWDSRPTGDNYPLVMQELYDSPIQFRTKTAGTDINIPAWQFIVDQMKE